MGCENLLVGFLNESQRTGKKMQAFPVSEDITIRLKAGDRVYIARADSDKNFDYSMFIAKPDGDDEPRVRRSGEPRVGRSQDRGEARREGRDSYRDRDSHRSQRPDTRRGNERRNERRPPPSDDGFDDDPEGDIPF